MPHQDVSINAILAENDRRNATIFAPFNPVTGEGSIGERFILDIPDYPIPRQWLPVTMRHNPLVARLASAGSVEAFLRSLSVEPSTEARLSLVNRFNRLRCRHDFPYWAATLVYIKDKEPGRPDCLFRLTFPQRRFVSRLEELRLADKPIRLVLLKARQWGGSTTSQLYMAWLQLIHRQALNSLIIAHQGTGSDEIKDMFDRMIRRYPIEMLHEIGEAYSPAEPKLVSVGKSGSIQRVPQRNCKIKIGTAERPDSCRGGDYALVHLSEVGIWKKTDGKSPEDIVRSACSGVLFRPYTMIVYESTANGVGNFFHHEYTATKDPKVKSQFEAMFVSWFDIELYRLPFDSEKQREEFARTLYSNRTAAQAPSDREEPGAYLWWLWTKGATLEGIHWYIEERAKYTDHGLMAAEFPSDDNEAFVNSGNRVFDKTLVDRFRSACRPPRCVGELSARGASGEEALMGINFVSDSNGLLHIWDLPEPPAPDDTDYVADRYLVVVDVGGRSAKADWSVIVVFDRLFMMSGRGPSVVAQWYGHIDMDLLAWKAAQIASFYCDALLVIESNTLETHDRQRILDGGDNSLYILNQIRDVYPNLYARAPSDEAIRQGLQRQYGFHTNIVTKPKVINTLIRAIREHLYVERDARCLDEYIDYERKQNGSYGAIEGSHDDLLMTRAIGLHICFHEMDQPEILPIQADYNSVAPTIISPATM